MSVLLVVAILVPLLNQVVPSSSPVHLSVFGITLIGKYLCYGMLALAVDLIWGYCGILSLGHAAFFSLGGYAMGMYLMRQIAQGRLRRSDLAGFHGVFELEVAAMVLVRF